MERLRVLVTNDDGIDSSGLEALWRAVGPLGECLVVSTGSEIAAVAVRASLGPALASASLPVIAAPECAAEGANQNSDDERSGLPTRTTAVRSNRMRWCSSARRAGLAMDVPAGSPPATSAWYVMVTAARGASVPLHATSREAGE